MILSHAWHPLQLVTSNAFAVFSIDDAIDMHTPIKRLYNDKVQKKQRHTTMQRHTPILGSFYLRVNAHLMTVLPSINLNTLLDIAQKNAESNYLSLKEDIAQNVQNINHNIIKAVNNAPRIGTN